MTEAVLDASALIAFLRNEPGAEKVSEVLTRCCISAVNLAETYGKMTEYGKPLESVAYQVERLHIAVIPFDSEQAKIAASLWKPTRAEGLSLGDRACLALEQARFLAPGEWFFEGTRNPSVFLRCLISCRPVKHPSPGGFRVKATIRRRLAARQRRIQRRLDPKNVDGCAKPIMTATNIHYELAERSQGLVYGGLGALHLLAKKLGLIDALDDRLHLLKFHFPYHESDHVLTLAYNALCDGTCLQDLELRRTDEVFLNALGARRLPDPTTSGDFCRRFERENLFTLLDICDETRLKVWAQQPDAFFDQAIVDMDGTLVETTGSCKQGMDVAYDGTWGYHPLVLSLANTGEVLSLVNRSGNRPSSDGAAEQVDRVLAVCFQGGFRKVLLRGDTDFSQTEHLDRWTDDPRVRFLFGYDATPNLKTAAENLPERAWKPLVRSPRYTVKTQPRERPDNVKEAIVVARQFENQRLQAEHVAEFPYQPSACTKSYRMIVVRKNLSVSKGERVLFDEVRYFFYLTNEGWPEPEELVPVANDRGNQENLLAQLHSGVRALRAPVNTLESNWAYMVMTALAWNLKAWWALSLPESPGRWRTRYQEEKRWLLAVEFKTFVSALVRLPCQLVRTGRKLVYRLLSWNPHQHLLFRLLDVVHC